jgi:hypothetical protein
MLFLAPTSFLATSCASGCHKCVSPVPSCSSNCISTQTLSARVSTLAVQCLAIFTPLRFTRKLSIICLSLLVPSAACTAFGARRLGVHWHSCDCNPRRALVVNVADGASGPACARPFRHGSRTSMCVASSASMPGRAATSPREGLRAVCVEVISVAVHAQVCRRDLLVADRAASSGFDGARCHVLRLGPPLYFQALRAFAPHLVPVVASERERRESERASDRERAIERVSE